MENNQEIKVGDTVSLVTYNGSVRQGVVTSVGRIYFYVGSRKFSRITYREASDPSNVCAYPEQVYAKLIVKKNVLMELKAKLHDLPIEAIASLLGHDYSTLIQEELTNLPTYYKDPT